MIVGARECMERLEDNFVVLVLPFHLCVSTRDELGLSGLHSKHLYP